MALQSYTIAVGNLQDDTSGNNYAVNKAVYILKQDKTIQPIFADFEGSTPITQDGVNNVTNNRGEFSFYVEPDDYIARVGGIDKAFTVVGSDYFNSKVEETVNLIIDAVAGRGAYYPIGSFEAGFTYTDINQVGTLGTAPNITYYVYTGGIENLPHTVTAGTDPTASGLYENVFYTDHNALTNRNATGAHDDIYIRTVTLAQATTEDAPVGTRYFLSDRSCGATVVDTDAPDGFFVIDINGTKQLKLSPLLATAIPEVTPRMAGADVGAPDNSTAIKAAYDFSYSNGFKFVFDKLYPTTQTVDFSSTGAQVDGVGRGIWRDADPVNSVVGGILYNGVGDAVTCGNGSQQWRNFKIRCDGASNSCIHLNGNAATLMDLEFLRLQNTGTGDGILITGNNGGESIRISRVESSNHNAALRLNRTDTQLNNMQLEKVNFHRNDYGCKFDSGIQRLNINDGSDLTLNAVAGVAFFNNVDTDSKIENNWFENNGTDILLDCDNSNRGVTTENNKFAEATNQAVYCKNGFIISNNDKVNSTPVGFKFDVSTSRSVIALGNVTGVTTLFSGDTSNLAIKPRQNVTVTEHKFTVQNVPASASGQFDIVGSLSGNGVVRLNKKTAFFSVDVQVYGATPTAGSMEVRISKNTSNNVNNLFQPTIDNTISNNRIFQVSPLGNNQFSTSADFDNFFLTYTTDASWDATTSEIFVIVKTLDVGV